MRRDLIGGPGGHCQKSCILANMSEKGAATTADPDLWCHETKLTRKEDRAHLHILLRSFSVVGLQGRTGNNKSHENARCKNAAGYKDVLGSRF